MSCTPGDLLDLAKCFNCLSIPQLEAIQTYLLCQIQSSGGGGLTGIPTGGIIMWSGTIATIPSGWFLCDGANSTPDLRNRFVVCANQDSGGVAKTNFEGVALQVGGFAVDETVPFGTVNALAGPGVNAWNGTQQGVPNASGGGSPITYAPPYFALAYIMKG